MAKTTKEMSKLDFEQTLKAGFADEISSAMTTGYVQGKVGHKIVANYFSPTQVIYEYYDSSTLVMSIRVTYTDASQATFLSAERIA